MLTLDLIKDAGGEAANFCRDGADLLALKLCTKPLETVLTDPNVKSLLVVLIGGFNRMDEMAEGIANYPTSPRTRDSGHCPYVRNHGRKRAKK